MTNERLEKMRVEFPAMANAIAPNHAPWDFVELPDDAHCLRDYDRTVTIYLSPRWLETTPETKLLNKRLVDDFTKDLLAVVWDDGFGAVMKSVYALWYRWLFNRWPNQ